MSKELVEAIEGYENYISANGITEEAIEAYVLAAETAMTKEKDKKYGLKVTARANDNIIEALEYKDKWYFIIGVQYHPELDDDKIFKYFINEVTKRV